MLTGVGGIVSQILCGDQTCCLIVVRGVVLVSWVAGGVSLRLVPLRCILKHLLL